MRQAFDGVIYDTDKATLVARSLPNVHSRSRYLFRTDKGAFFLYRVHETPSVGVSLGIEITPLTADEAIQEYNLLEERELDFPEAFPDTDFMEA